MDTNQLQLNEAQRSQLDGIVQRMIQNKEPDSAIQFVVNDFKQKYGTRVQEEPGFFSNLGTGIKNIALDIAGVKKNESQGYIPSLFKSTIGSEGLAGVAQMPGRTIAQAGIVSQTTDTEKKIAELSKQAGDAYVQARNTTDPNEREKLLTFARQTQANAADLRASNNELGKEIFTPGQAIGTTINAGLTALTGAKPNILGEFNPAFASLAKNTSFISKGAKALYYGGRIAENAAIGAGFQAASNLNNNRNITEGLGTAGAFGAAIPLAGTVASKAKNAILAKATPAAETFINSLIKPLQKDFAYGKNPARGILNEGIIANSLEDLDRKVADRTIHVGSEIGKVGGILEKSGVTLDLMPALRPIDEAIQNAAKNNNPTLLNSLNNVKIALMNELKAETDKTGIANIVRGNPKNLIGASYNEAKNFLSDIAEHTRFTGNISDDKALNMATKRAYGVAREIMNKTADKVDPALGQQIRNLNERYGDLLSARSAINHRELVLKRQNILNLADRFGLHISVGSSVATGLLTGDWSKAGTVLLSSLGAVAAQKVGGSAAVKTRVAQFISRLAPEERQGILNSTPVLKNWYERMTGQSSPSENAPKTLPLKAVQGTVKAVKETPNKQGGFVAVGKQVFDYTKAVNGLNNTGRSAILDFVAGSKEVNKEFIQNIADKMKLPNRMKGDKALREDFIKVLDADRSQVKTKLKK